MKEPALVAAIVRSVRAAVQVPLTVKMRSGFDPAQRNAPDVAFIAQEEGAELVTVHWRTRADGYGGQRAVDRIAATVDRLSIPVLGNGDVVDVDSAQAMLRDTGCDGLMIGRGAMRNPWIFRQVGAWLAGLPVPAVAAADRHQALLSYLEGCRRHLSTVPRSRKSDPDKATLGRFKQLCKYFLDEVPGGGEVRTAVLRSESVAQAEALVEAFFGEQGQAA